MVLTLSLSNLLSAKAAFSTLLKGTLLPIYFYPKGALWGPTSMGEGSPVIFFSWGGPRSVTSTPPVCLSQAIEVPDPCLQMGFIRKIIKLPEGT